MGRRNPSDHRCRQHGIHQLRDMESPKNEGGRHGLVYSHRGKWQERSGLGHPHSSKDPHGESSNFPVVSASVYMLDHNGAFPSQHWGACPRHPDRNPSNYIQPWELDVHQEVPFKPERNHSYPLEPTSASTRTCISLLRLDGFNDRHLVAQKAGKSKTKV